MCGGDILIKQTNQTKLQFCKVSWQTIDYFWSIKKYNSVIFTAVLKVIKMIFNNKKTRKSQEYLLEFISRYHMKNIYKWYCAYSRFRKKTERTVWLCGQWNQEEKTRYQL